MKSLVEFILEKLRPFNVWIMVGLPGSGKSTWIKKNLPKNIKIVNQDQIRVDLGIMKDIDIKRIGDKEQESKVSEINMNMINKYMDERVDFVIDNINISTGRVLNYFQMLKRRNANVKIVVIDTPLRTCISRRQKDIPKDVLEKMYFGFEKVKNTFKNNNDCMIVKT